jgi:hypothetical protein
MDYIWLAELRQEKVRCSVICLSAEVRLYKTLASRTRGKWFEYFCFDKDWKAFLREITIVGVFSVPMSVESFRDAMLDHTPPPPTQKDVTGLYFSIIIITIIIKIYLFVASLLEMGFPKERRDANPALCVW